MRKLSRILTSLAVIGTVMCAFSAWAQEVPLVTGSHDDHIFPTVSGAGQLHDIDTSGAALIYNGGPVMSSPVQTHAIFWLPSKLQNGVSTSMSPAYQPVETALLSLYPGHGIDNNNTQYYQQTGCGLFCSVTDYIQNTGGLAGTYVDTSAYPASGCTDPATPGNCITDAQIQAEIQKVMTSQKWTGGLNNIFLLFTSSGEGSEDSYGDLAYEQMCAYHGYFFSGSTPIIYADIPYGNTTVCQTVGTPSPNGDAVADTAATAVSHELTEAITDPELNAWLTASGSEIGDLCAYNYGTNSWDSGKANQFWGPASVRIVGFFSNPVTFFELQEEYDNHAGACVQIGP